MRPGQPSTQYQIASFALAGTVSVFAAIFYYLTTQDAPLRFRISGIAVNMFAIILMAKDSTDVQKKLLKEGKYKKAAASLAGSAGLYLPQTIIAGDTATSVNDGFAAFAAIATLTSGGFTYLYSLSKNISFMQSKVIPKAKKVIFLTRKLHTADTYKDKEIVVQNLKILLERLRFIDYKREDLSVTPENDVSSINAIIGRALALGEATPISSQNTCSTSFAATLILQIATALVLLYGSFGYYCATENTLKKYLHLPDKLAAQVAQVLMSCQYLLNFKAGFMLGGNIGNTISAVVRQRQLPNDLKLRGYCFLVGALLFSTGLTSFSGYTAESLYNKNCSTSSLAFLMFPHANDLIDYSTRIFNGTFAAMSLIAAKDGLIKHGVDSVERNYLVLIEHVESLLFEVEKMDPTTVKGYLEALGNDCERLLAADLFPKPASDDLDHGHLQGGYAALAS